MKDGEEYKSYFYWSTLGKCGGLKSIAYFQIIGKQILPFLCLSPHLATQGSFKINARSHAMKLIYGKES